MSWNLAWYCHQNPVQIALLQLCKELQDQQSTSTIMRSHCSFSGCDYLCNLFKCFTTPSSNFDNDENLCGHYLFRLGVMFLVTMTICNHLQHCCRLLNSFKLPNPGITVSIGADVIIIFKTKLQLLLFYFTIFYLHDLSMNYIVHIINFLDFI